MYGEYIKLLVSAPQTIGLGAFLLFSDKWIRRSILFGAGHFHDDVMFASRCGCVCGRVASHFFLHLDVSFRDFSFRVGYRLDWGGMHCTMCRQTMKFTWHIVRDTRRPRKYRNNCPKCSSFTIMRSMINASDNVIGHRLRTAYLRRLFSATEKFLFFPDDLISYTL